MIERYSIFIVSCYVTDTNGNEYRMGMGQNLIKMRNLVDFYRYTVFVGKTMTALIVRL